MSQAKAVETEAQEVLYEVADHVATITLNAPERDFGAEFSAPG